MHVAPRPAGCNSSIHHRVIIYTEVIYMRSFIEICHGCGRELYTYEIHWKVTLKWVEKPVYFHNMCFVHYKECYPNKIAEEKRK